MEGEGRHCDEFSFDVVAVVFGFVVCFVHVLFSEVGLAVDADIVGAVHVDNYNLVL